MRFTYIVLITFGIFASIFLYVTFAPIKLDQDKNITLDYGTSVIKSADILKDQGLIRSKDIYLILSKIFYPNGTIAGTYTFSGNVNMFDLLHDLSKGNFGRDQIKFTIPEGFTNTEIVNRTMKLFPNFDKNFISNFFTGKEGYIYPETYFFDKNITQNAFVEYIYTKSEQKLKSIFKPNDIYSKEVKRILTIASLVESEGRSAEERRMISQIINNRIDKNMPLQLDATLTYLTGKGSSELTIKDLKIDSPYNTYVYKGLPPGPISNPGEESIFAAMNPEFNDFLFYLHDKDGKIHYAKTFKEHVKNKQKYLN